MLALAAGVAYTRDLRGDLDENGDFIEDDEEEVEPEDEIIRRCKHKATGPGSKCWHRSDKYMSLTR